MLGIRKVGMGFLLKMSVDEWGRPLAARVARVLAESVPAIGLGAQWFVRQFVM